MTLGLVVDSRKYSSFVRSATARQMVGFTSGCWALATANG